MKEENVLCCIRVSDKSEPFPGSSQSKCDSCGAAIWISAAGSQTKFDRRICTVCYAPSPDDEFGTTTALVKELEEWQQQHPQNRLLRKILQWIKTLPIVDAEGGG